MSNRLTFSLASLILIFAFGFVAMPVMAADGGPTVTIAKDGTPTRSAYTLKFTFNMAVADFDDEGDIEFRYYDENDQLLGDVWGRVTPSSTAKPTEYTVSLDVSGPASGAKGFQVRVPENAATGNTTNNDKGSQANSEKFPLPPVVAVGSLVLSLDEKSPQDTTTDGKDYVLTLTYKNADGDAADPSTDPSVTDITISPSYLRTAAVGSNTIQQATDNSGVFTLDFIHPTDAPDLTIDVEDVYFTGATPAAGFVVPIPVPAKQNPPTVTLTVSEHNKTNRVFRVDVSTTPANDTKGNAGAAIAGSAIKAALSVKDSSTPAIDVGVNLLDGDTGNERKADNSYIAYLEYGVFDKLPLTVSIDPNDLATNTDAADVAPVADGVGGDPTTPPVAGAPGMPTGVTATADQAADTVTLSWTAPTDTGGSAITGYTITQTGQADTSYTAAADATSYTTPKLAAGDYSFTVAATNATGTGTASAAVTATIDAAPVTPDTTPPTVTITVESTGPATTVGGAHRVDTDGMVRFKLLFDEPLAKAPSVSRLEVRDISIMDHARNAITDGVTLSAATAEGDGEYYILAVPAPAPIMPLPVNNREPEREVHIEVTTLGVADDATPTANPLGGTRESRMAKFDTIPPEVAVRAGYFNASGIWVAATKGEPMGELAFEFAFSEPLSPEFSTSDVEGSTRGANFKLDRGSDPVAVPGKKNAFTVLATVIDINKPTTLGIERLEVADAAENKLQEDEHATYSPTTQAPVASISATSPFYCGVHGNLVTVRITDNEAIATGEAIAEGEISVSTGWKIKTGSFSGPAATAGAKFVTATFTVIRNDVENARDRTWLGIQEVKITVAAAAVKDNTNQTNAAKAMSYTAGPVITIPGTAKAGPDGGYVVVVRSNASNTSHLNHVRTLFLGDPNVRADNVPVQYWDCMPDLGLIFDVTVDASPGVGGGGLMLLQSRDHKGTKIAKGTVGISEIMWSEDRGVPFGNYSNLQHAREQWIELHNTNSFDVTVTLFDLIRTEAYHTNDASRADLVDVMSNYDIGERWNVQEKDANGNPKYGTDGNSQLGHDFISMQRRVPASDKNYAHGERQGRNKGHWSASPYVYLTRSATLAGSGQVPAANLLYNFQGSPGRKNDFDAPGPITKSKVARSPVIFNEIANRRDETLEWIELRNVTDAEVNLRNYQISIVTAKGTDKAFYTFPNNDNTKIAAKGLLLLVDTDPRDNDAHPVAVGHNIHTGNDQALGIGDDAPRYAVTNFAEGGLPNDGKFVLILRKPEAHDKAGTAKPGNDTRVVDLAGYDDDLADPSIHTHLWPLKVFPAPFSHGALNVETVNFRRDPGRDGTSGEKNEAGKTSFHEVGYTAVGYKRHAQRNAAHGGTPGYEDTRKNLVADVKATGVLTISEIMYDQGDGEYPQWIEIYNSSDIPVNLHSEAGWRLVIENYDDPDRDPLLPVETLSGTLNFKNSDVQTILPKQTVLVTSTRARSSGSAFFDTRVIFPATRVFSVWDDARGELFKKEKPHPTDEILSDRGFYIELIDGKGNLSDGVGNLVKSPNRRAAQDIVWELSEIPGGIMEEDGRSSILRRYRKPGTDARYSDQEISDMGVEAAGWISAHITKFLDVRKTWYGDQDDVGSPGITGGRVLPVELSKFRPERLESGDIVIRWITQSELNNAGFNILRSEKSDAEFKQINTKLIAGQGTTSEKTTYEWKDTTAKPNVVYYYQIQDVSLDGKVQTLRISRLKGNVSAEGKLTTTWGELKALQ